MKISKSDRQHVRQVAKELQKPCTLPECRAGCDCHDREIVMLSTGYAEVRRDGSVVAHGVVVYRSRTAS